MKLTGESEAKITSFKHMDLSGNMDGGKIAHGHLASQQPIRYIPWAGKSLFELKPKFVCHNGRNIVGTGMILGKISTDAHDTFSRVALFPDNFPKPSSTWTRGAITKICWTWLHVNIIHQQKIDSIASRSLLQRRCHAWAVLGQWANFVAFPLGDGFKWARHGHTGRFRDKYKKRVPSFTGWARPVFEQGTLPVLASLPAQCLVGVLPGALMFQSDTFEKTHVRPPQQGCD